MYKPKRLAVILLLSLLLPLFAGCQVQFANDLSQPTDLTEPSTEATEPSSEATEPTEDLLELTEENIKTYITEGITYGEVRDLFGKSHQNTSSDPLNKGDRVWIFDTTYDPVKIDLWHYPGAYLVVEFRFPGYETYDQWFEECVDKSTIPTEIAPNGEIIYDASGTDLLADWIANMEAVYAGFYKGRDVIEVLFDTEGTHPQPTDPLQPTDPPIDEYRALLTALNQNGVLQDAVEGCKAELDLDDPIPHWDVTYRWSEYEYEFEIECYSAEVLHIEREFVGSLENKEIFDHIPSAETATEIAKVDRLVKKIVLYWQHLTIHQVNESAPGSGIYTVYMTSTHYHYKLKVAPKYNMVLDLEITNIDYYEANEGLIDTSVADAEAALNIALKHAILSKAKVSNFEFEEIPYDSMPRYELEFDAGDDSYEYVIHAKTGIVIGAQREFEGELGEIINSEVTRQAAINIALRDPLVQASAKLRAAYPCDQGAYYEVLLSSNRYNDSAPGYYDQDNFEYRLKISVEHNKVLELSISYKPYRGTYGDRAEDGRIGLEKARKLSVEHIRDAGIVFDKIASTFYCNEGIDTAERSGYYEAYFEYNGEGCYYYLDMYTGDLLGVEKVPLN